MRVIAGTHRGRRLHGPQGCALRPTSDRVREALFSIIGNRLSNCRFLDLYAGTGAVAVEALSRGAAHVTCVESDAEALKLLRRNVADCGMGRYVTIQPQIVSRFLGRPDQWSDPYNIVFADPPYTVVQELDSLLVGNTAIGRLLAADSWLIVEHHQKTTLATDLGLTTFLRRYRYGDTALSLYSFSGATPL